MAVTLEWVRDHYDSTKDRLIDINERNNAHEDWAKGIITLSEFSAVMDAYTKQTLLPAYGAPISPMAGSHVMSIIISTGSALKVDGVEVI